ncbi:uncharacterized protein LOC114729766 [Neltuma alba]|uniref:uncharacterized protein LOC114729766 n=1 Tax=Neltuma alba TaxID=207710 RepID=UPI0010A31C8E|nr:uncharacterized protein LOC114729766 [Prosopis alba]
MAPTFDSVRAINPCRQNWKIKVRVVRLWTMPGRYSHEEISSMEMILRDEDGDNIHAIVKTAFLPRHRKNFEEGKTYVVSYFYVSPNTGSYRTTNHPYRANFIFSTSVRPYADDGKINNFGFVSHSLSKILADQFDDRYLIDVIGLLTGVGEKEECNVNGHTQFRLDVELLDEGKEKLECTPWGDFTNEVLQHVSRVHTGRKKVSNSMYSSPLLIHLAIQEVQEFLQILKSVGIQLGQTPARIAPQIVVSVADDLLALDDHRKIVDLRFGPTESIVITMADIVDMRSNRGWMYTSCKQCSKKVVPDGEESKVAIVNTTNVEKANPFGNFSSADCQVEVKSSKHNACFVEIPSTTSGHNGAKNGTENMLNHPLGGNLEADENNTSFARRRRAKRKQI